MMVQGPGAGEGAGFPCVIEACDVEMTTRFLQVKSKHASRSCSNSIELHDSTQRVVMIQLNQLMTQTVFPSEG